MVGQRNRLERVACTPFDRDCHNLPSSELKERLIGCSGKWCNIIEISAPSYPLLLLVQPVSTASVWRGGAGTGMVSLVLEALPPASSAATHAESHILSTDLRELSILISCCEPRVDVEKTCLLHDRRPC